METAKVKVAVQVEGGKPESLRQDTDVQTQCNADNTSEPNVTPHPIVTGKNNNQSSLLSKPINNDNKTSFQIQ